MKKLILACGLLVAINVHASEDCIDIKTDSKRLACYDSAYMPTVTNTTDGDEVSKGSWVTSIEESAKNDQTNAFMMLDSENTFIGRWGRSEQHGTLSIQCRENSTQLYFNLGGEHLVSSEYNSYGDVGYRIDDQKLSKWSMVESTNNEALGLWNGSGIPQLKKLIEGTKLQVWITPYSENEKHLTFDLTGIDDAIKDVRANCNW